MSETTRRRLRGAALACALLGSAAAQADSFDPSFPATSLAAPLDAVTLRPGGQTAVARSGMITGTDSIVLPIVVAGGMPGGTFSVTLTDLGWPASMSSLSL